MYKGFDANIDPYSDDNMAASGGDIGSDVCNDVGKAGNVADDADESEAPKERHAAGILSVNTENGKG